MTDGRYAGDRINVAEVAVVRLSPKSGGACRHARCPVTCTLSYHTLRQWVHSRHMSLRLRQTVAGRPSSHSAHSLACLTVDKQAYIVSLHISRKCHAMFTLTV